MSDLTPYERDREEAAVGERFAALDRESTEAECDEAILMGAMQEQQVQDKLDAVLHATYEHYITGCFLASALRKAGVFNA